MTENEKIIANMSYTNSDFRTIYPELLDTAKKLSNKWDPSLSNESDPGVVLLKENAIIADKNNYHCDKNILEAFPLSLTQQASARQLYDLAGYNMHWYKSAICDISFSLLNSIEEINSKNEGLDISSINIESGTVIVDSTGEQIYTTLETSAELKELNSIVTVKAIQGSIHKYEINGNYNITIDNLDEDLRLYFTDNMIAQNGIFVYDSKESNFKPSSFRNDEIDSNSGTWKIVDNLAEYESGSRVFKFGVSINNDTCYIQFPQDIDTLIGSGLSIFYTTTQGTAGAVKSQVLNTFKSDIKVKNNDSDVIINSYIKISNSNSTTGEDIETLDEAYRNYKKTVGTFNTLVTRKDYQSAIYNLGENTTEGNLISNCVIADRTNDMNNSNYIIQWDLNDSYKKLYVTEKDGTPTLRPYDIVLYLLNKSNTMASEEDYNRTFIQDNTVLTRYRVEEGIDALQSIQHNYSYPNGAYFGIQNICVLTGNITTFYKVSRSEAGDIEKNVLQALYKNYNSREIDFGKELDYNDLIETIKNADSRIRNVALNIPSYEPTLIKNNALGNVPLYSDKTDAINDETLAKMILSGKSQLFKFQEDFQYDFGQIKGKGDSDNPAGPIQSITTYATLTIPANPNTEGELELKDNELVQIITPSLVTLEAYQARVRYEINFDYTTPNQPHAIVASDVIKVTYLDPATNTTIEKQNLNEDSKLVGKVFISNISLNSSGTLLTGQKIEIKEISNITIPTKTNYYFITNKVEGNNYILDLSTEERILQENEYFIYKSSKSSSLVILGSGTSLYLAEGSKSLYCKEVSFNDIINSESNTDINIEWKSLDIDIKAQENYIVNLNEGSKIWLTGRNAEAIKLSDTDSTINKMQVINIGKDAEDNDIVKNVSINYTLNGTSDTISSIDNLITYRIRVQSRLMINANQIEPQVLLDGQHMVLKIKDTNDTIVLPQANANNVLFSYPVILAGGTDIDMKVLDVDTNTYGYKLNAYYYEATTPVSNSEIKRSPDGLLTLSAVVEDVLSTEYNLNYSFDTVDRKKYYLIPVSVSLDTNTKCTIFNERGYINKDMITIENDKIVDISKTSEPITESGNYILIVSGGSLKIKFESTIADGQLTAENKSKISLKYIQQFNGVNTDELNSREIGFDYNADDRFEDILIAINNINGNKNFDWTYKVPNIDKVLNPLSANSYFNINHVYNQYTIPKIEFGNTKIKVTPSSIT